MKLKTLGTILLGILVLFALLLLGLFYQRNLSFSQNAKKQEIILSNIVMPMNEFMVDLMLFVREPNNQRIFNQLKDHKYLLSITKSANWSGEELHVLSKIEQQNRNAKKLLEQYLSKEIVSGSEEHFYLENQLIIVTSIIFEDARRLSRLVLGQYVYYTQNEFKYLSILIVFSVLGILCISIFTYRILSSRVLRLLESMQEIKEGRYRDGLKPTFIYEFQKIYNLFGEMVVAIQDSDLMLREKVRKKTQNLRKLIMRLKESQTVFNYAHEGIVITDKDNKILFVNASFERITGYKREEVVGKFPSLLKSGVHGKEFYENMRHDLGSRDIWVGEITNRKKDGTLYTELLSIKVIRDAHGEIIRHIATFTDISQRKINEKRIWEQANYDAVTGLPNRYYFRDLLERSLREANRDHENVALFFIDLDGFKEINDTHGHDCGDIVLKTVADRITRLIRKRDVCARYGGDEFTVIIRESKYDFLDMMAERIIEEIEQKIFFEETRSGRVSASLGVAVSPKDANDTESLIQFADQSMYASKKAGGGKVFFFNKALAEKAQRKITLKSRLKAAIQEESFQVEYQPIVRLNTGRIEKCEALIRWKDEELGQVPPMEFISFAENNQLIIPIQKIVIKKVIDDLLQMTQSYPQLIDISVNLSAHCFTNHEFMEYFLDILDQHCILSHKIHVEITETALMHNVDVLDQSIKELVDRGIELSLDDFGTGYSSLSYLQKFPINYLKIDKSFIDKIVDDPQGGMVAPILSLCNRLNLNVIAEGVEKRHQLSFLRAHGCDYGQGYYFSKSLPIDPFIVLLKENQNPSGGYR